MSVADFGGRVAACSATEGEPRYAAILDIIALVLPILMNLPCFKSATPEEAQKKIEDRPFLARIQAKSLIRSKSKDSTIRKDAGSIADDMLHVFSTSSKEEFASVFSSARA